MKALFTMILSVALMPPVPRAPSLAAAQQQPAGKFALLVGIDKYQNVMPLKGAVKDVTEMKKLLTGPKFGFDPANVVTIVDESATAENILKTFRTHLIENAKKFHEQNNREAVVVFHYSGHGSSVPGNEPDGFDETLVPFNSRDKEGKNFDILDDDIGVLIADLARYTTNATYIFDSCHSGTVNRGDLIAREVPEDTRPQPEREGAPRVAGNRAMPRASKDEFLAADDKYTMITGSRSNEKSYEIALADGSSQGALTYYLLNELRNITPQTTYRELMRRVAAAVSHNNPNQHSQLLGDGMRMVMNGSVRDDDYYIEVTGVQGREITIAAGEAMGVKAGTLVAIYSPETSRLKGEQGKLVESEVIRGTATSSVISFTPRPGLRIAPGAKAVLISPLFGARPLRVALDQGGAEAGAGAVLRAVLQRLQDSKLVEAGLAGSPNVKVDADAYVRLQKFAEVFKEKPEPRKSPDGKTVIPNPKDDDEVFYIAAAGGEPLFDFYAGTNDEKSADRIAGALEKLARQNNLEALENLGSPISPNIEVSVIAVTGVMTPQGFRKESEEPLKPARIENEIRVKPGTYYRLRIKNNYSQALFITAVNISSDGAIHVMYPSDAAQEALRAGQSVETNLYVTTRPYGEETFKIIATRQFSDFRPLAQEGIRGNAEGPPPLKRLMERALVGIKPGPADVSFGGAAWGTAQLSFTVVP